MIRPRHFSVLIHHKSWMDDSFPGMPDQIRILRNPAEASQADVVLFHLPTLKSIRINKYTNQLWVGWSLESEENYPILKALKAKARSYFDLWMTYQQESEIWCPYFDRDIEHKLLNSSPSVWQKSRVAYFGSNAADLCGRVDFVRELMAHARVDSFGRSLNNMPQLDDHGHETKIKTIAGYKFTLALENSVAIDYVTEKFFDPLLAGSIPVYRGAPNIAEFAPGEKCYIDANFFRSPRELAEYLNQLSANQELCAEFHKWRTQPLRASFLHMLNRVRPHVFERLRTRYENAFGNSTTRAAIYRFS